jgi:hypothetical protein
MYCCSSPSPERFPEVFAMYDRYPLPNWSDFLDGRMHGSDGHFTSNCFDDGSRQARAKRGYGLDIAPIWEIFPPDMSHFLEEECWSSALPPLHHSDPYAFSYYQDCYQVQ